MRIHQIALASTDWSGYWHRDEEDGRVFLSASFSPGLSRGDFPELPVAIGGSLPSLGVHPLLPYVVKHFGFACSDPRHLVYEDLVYSLEQEWAWCLCGAYMNEVWLHGRAFVPPVEVLSFLGRLAPTLPDGPFHPVERGSPPVPLSYSSVLDLMHRAVMVPERNRQPWIDYSTGTRSLFLAYDCQGDGFLARPNPPAAGSSRSKGGVGSAVREARRKRHRDLDGEPPAVVLAGANVVRDLPDVDHHTVARPTLPLLPSLGSVDHPGAPRSAALNLEVARDELTAISRLSRALGSFIDRSWTVEGLHQTLTSWYLERSSEARRLGAERQAFAVERDSLAAQLHRAQGELEALRKASSRHASDSQRAITERDRYRRERDALRAIRVVPSLAVLRLPRRVWVLETPTRVSDALLRQVMRLPVPQVPTGVGPRTAW